MTARNPLTKKGTSKSPRGRKRALEIKEEVETATASPATCTLEENDDNKSLSNKSTGALAGNKSPKRKRPLKRLLEVREEQEDEEVKSKRVCKFSTSTEHCII